VTWIFVSGFRDYQGLDKVEIVHSVLYSVFSKDVHTTSYTASSFAIVVEESLYDASNPWRAKDKISRYKTQKGFVC